MTAVACSEPPTATWLFPLVLQPQYLCCSLVLTFIEADALFVSHKLHHAHTVHTVQSVHTVNVSLVTIALLHTYCIYTLHL